MAEVANMPEELNFTLSLEEFFRKFGRVPFIGRDGDLYRLVLRSVEKPLIENALDKAKGNQLKAAKILGINRNTLRKKIRKLGIEIKRFKKEG